MNADFRLSFKINFNPNQIGTVIPTKIIRGNSVSENDIKRILIEYSIITGKTAKRIGWIIILGFMSVILKYGLKKSYSLTLCIICKIERNF